MNMCHGFENQFKKEKTNLIHEYDAMFSDKLEEYCAGFDDEHGKLLNKIDYLQKQLQRKKPNLKPNTNSTSTGPNVTFATSMDQ